MFYFTLGSKAYLSVIIYNLCSIMKDDITDLSTALVTTAFRHIYSARRYILSDKGSMDVYYCGTNMSILHPYCNNKACLCNTTYFRYKNITCRTIQSHRRTILNLNTSVFTSLLYIYSRNISRDVLFFSPFPYKFCPKLLLFIDFYVRLFYYLSYRPKPPFEIYLKPPFEKLLVVRSSHEGPKFGLSFYSYEWVYSLLHLHHHH